MADTFTRDSLSAYEKAPQAQVADTTNPFAGARPAGVADPAAIAAVQSGNTDATPAAQAGRRSAATPSSDSEVVISEDQPVAGDGTSDSTEDQSTSTDDPGVDSETVSNDDDLVGEPIKPAPKKGSAAERIVEVLDLAEGYKEYGKLKEKQVAELQAELEQLRTGRATPAADSIPAAADAAAPVKAGPMPKISDPDINYDEEKFEQRMASWIDARAEQSVASRIQKTSAQQEQARLRESVNAKVAIYAAEHPDFETVALKNPVLAKNQLAEVASLAIARSPHTAEILHAFGKDTDMAVRTAKLAPADQLLEVGRIIGEIERAKAEGKNPQPGAKPGAKKSITQAPPPPKATPAAGRAQARDVLDPGMGMDEFARQHRTAKQADRLQARKMRGLA